MSLSHILFVELVGGLGDVVMALPAIRGLARSHPAAEVAVFCFAPYVSLLHGEPYISTVYGATRRDWPDGTPMAKDELARVLVEQHFDLAISDVRYGGIEQVIEASGVNHAVTRLWDRTDRNERIEHCFLRNLTEQGWVRPEFADDIARLHLTDNERLWADAWHRMHADSRRVVLLNTDSGIDAKRWPAENFVALGRELQRLSDTTILVAGSDHAGLAKGIAEKIGRGAVVLPRLPIRQFASIAAQCSLMVSSDTGPARVAAAVGTPVVALFGPTWAGRYGLPAPNVNLQSPYRCDTYEAMNTTKQPCWYGRCAQPDKRSCMDDLDWGVVWGRVLRLLEDRRAA